MLNDAAGIKLAHISYNGSGPATLDLVAGRVQMEILDWGTIGPQVHAGKLRVLAVTGPKRWPLLPDVPTFVEQGYSTLDLAGWNGIMAPAHTPPSIIKRMSTEINKIIQSPEGRKQLLRMGLLATGTTPEQFAAVIKRDTPRWGKMIHKAGVKPR